jgi:glycopeptide antibiotics resistance protein
VLANIALFVPLGYLLTALVRRPVLVLALCLLGSAAIELSQREFLPTRVPSVADVQHNVLGAVVGVLLAVPLIWIGRWGSAQRGAPMSASI